MKDCSVALLDADHRVLGQSAGPADLPRQPRDLHAPDRGDVRPRGVAAGRRLDHERLVPDRHAPQRHDGLRADLPRRRRSSASPPRRAHWLDVGAKDPGGPMDSTEIFQEGLRLGADARRRGRRAAPRHHRPARPQQPLPVPGDRRPRRADRLRAHGRAAARRRSSTASAARRSTRRARRDLRADRAARARGRRARSRTACTPPRAASTTTASAGEPCWVRVRVEVAGDAMTIDLDRVRRRARAGPINCGEAQAISACRVAFKLLDQPRAARRTAARSAPLDGARAAAARCSRAEEPSPCQWYFTPLGLLIDLVVKALAAGAARAGRGRELRRLDDHHARGHRPPHGPAVPRPRADRRRLGRVARAATARAG